MSVKKNVLAGLIDAQKRESFRPEILDQIDDEKACGVLLAHYFDFDGAALLAVAAAALTDANFHEEATCVRALLETLEAVA
jgi:hypothetical protein